MAPANTPAQQKPRAPSQTRLETGEELHGQELPKARASPALAPGEGREVQEEAERRRKGFLLINLIGEAPAVLGVGVSMPRVDEAVFKRLADVVGRQPGHRGHRVSGELPHV